MSAPEIVRLPDQDAVADAVARSLLERLALVQAQGRVPRIALTGGDIADVMHRRVAELVGSGLADVPDVDWSLVDIWWGDERYVAADDAQRNAGQARAALLDRVAVDPERVHEMPAADAGYADVGAAAEAYGDEMLREGPTETEPFDVVMLGLGGNGHIASLMPRQSTLDVVDRDVVPVTDSPKPPPTRISLTYPALNRTRDIWFIVAGEQKAEPVARAVHGVDLHEIPASGVHGQERTVWFLDEAAASALQ
jgi:6-phosphogluconolactonase